MVPRRKMVPEEYKAGRSAMSFAGCIGFFDDNGATVFDLARRDGTKLHKRVLGYDHRRIKQDIEEVKDLNFFITTQDN